MVIMLAIAPVGLVIVSSALILGTITVPLTAAVAVLLDCTVKDELLGTEETV